MKVLSKLFIFTLIISIGFQGNCQDFKSIEKGIQQYEKGKYEKSNYYLINSLPGVIQVFGENDTALLPLMYYFISTNYFNLEDYNKSKVYAKKALKIYDLNKEYKNFDYLVLSSQNLGVIFDKYGYYQQSAKYWKDAYQYAIKGPLDENLIELSYGLGTSLANSGNNLEAEKYLLESLQQTKALYGKKSLRYAQTANALGVLFLEMGNFSKAEELVKSSVEVKKELSGEMSHTYITSLGNLAIIYQKIGKYKESEDIYLKNINLAKTVVGEKDALYAINLFNLGYLYYVQKQFKEAILKQELAYSIILVNQGKTHPYYAPVSSGLGLTFLYLKDYHKAAYYLLEGKMIQEKKLGKNHVNYAATVFHLGKCYDKMNKPEKAKEYFKEAMTIYSDNIFNNFSHLSEKEKEMYFTTKADEINGFYEFAVRNYQDFPILKDEVFNNILRTKGILLKSSTAFRNAVINSNNPELQNTYDNWIQLKKEISKLNSLELSQRNSDPLLLEKKADSLERLLAQKVDIFSSLQKFKTIRWEEIRDNLKTDEVAIEFLRYKTADDSIFYLALIINQKSEHPELIKLFEESQLAKLMKNGSGGNFQLINGLYGTKEKPNQFLYDILWKPLLPYIESAKTIYYSPDGILHKISLSGILKSKNVFLTSIYNLQFVSTTATLIEKTTTISISDLKAGIYGGADFDLGAKTPAVWSYLPGTKTEAESLSKTFAKAQYQAIIHIGNDATEYNFKNEAANHNLLHIATHGFFFPDPETVKKEEILTSESIPEALAFRSASGTVGQNQFINNPNPLMRSGLVLAGANAVWNSEVPIEGEDGVLTAQEVANLDLQHTSLVVLSACETGLGDIRGSEGVYGLQRAFKMAGAKYLIMSLWQVPDKETAEFMKQFYTLLLNGKDIREAFIDTQKMMGNKYDPYFWAAFVLIE